MLPWYIILFEELIRASVCPLALRVDGALCDMLSSPYPKPEPSLQKGTYAMGNTSEAAHMS